MSSSRSLPPSVSAAAVAGWVGGAIAWLISSGWKDLSPLMPSDARLDQFVALLFGAAVGGCVLTLRARHRRAPLVPALCSGVLFGGVAATLGATMGLLLRVSDSPLGFGMERIATWALMAACPAATLSMCTRPERWLDSAESLALGALGGATAGGLFSFPGPSEMWLPLAMTWCGGAIGFAVVGPGIWHAPAVIQQLPPHDYRQSLWSLHERAVDNDWSVPVAAGQIGVVDDIVYIYPPPSGAILDGYPLYRSAPLTRDVLLAVGKIRFRVTLGRRS